MDIYIYFFKEAFKICIKLISAGFLWVKKESFKFKLLKIVQGGIAGKKKITWFVFTQ